MRSRVRLKQMLRVMLPLLAAISAIPVAAASAHGGGDSGGFRHGGFWADHAAIAGTVTSVGNGSFSATAHALTPGAGNSSTTPSDTAVTITLGSGTKVVTAGQPGIVSGDDFYAVYADVPAGADLTALASDTPTVVYAYAAPTPEVEVEGVVTTAPASGSDSFTATAFVVAPEHFFPGGVWGGDGGRHHPGSWGAGGGSWSGDSGGDSGTSDSSGTGVSAGASDSSSGSAGFSYSYGGKVGGAYGYSGISGSGDSGHISSVRGAHVRSRCLPAGTSVSDGTPGTVITTDSSTQITIGGQTTSISNLAVGDHFTAVYDGTPDESLPTITSTPALSVAARAPFDGGSLYAFVGTVSSTDVASGSVTVNVTSSFPNGLFSGTDTFDVGSQTIVLGNSGSSLFGTLSSVQTGDVVAGGLIAPSGESATTVESSPLQVLVDFPPSSSSSSTTQQASIQRAERRALKLLRRERAKSGHHKKR